jgi:type I restriction enzyme, S subunit
MTARRFKPYPVYMDSGIEWLGDIPSHWGVNRLKHLASLNPESLAEDTDPGLEIVYVDIGGVDGLGRIVEREQFTFGSAPSRARRIVRDGDVIVSTVRTYLRAIAPIRNPEAGLVVSTGFAVVRPTQGLTTDYAAHALRAPYFVERVVASSTGVSFPAINESEMATYELAAPSEPEQRAIAAFLDRETARIDALVAKKERLIELLQEKRAALITRAVTKGLDPTVPVKDSGVEWLGEIPAHWDVKALSRTLLRITYGFTNPMPVADAGPYMLTALDIGDGEILYASARRTTEEAFERLLTDKSRPRAGDLLITKDGTLGRVAVAGLERMCINQSIALLRFAPTVDVGFIQHTLRAAPYQERIYITRLARMSIALPAKEEQRVIAAFLDRETARIDALIAKIRDAISRLKELRAALISAAVTGKIDVRDEAA